MFTLPEILILATSRNSHGGISSVVAAHESTSQWREFGCQWVATHRSGSKLVKLLYLFRGLFVFLCLLPWSKVVHMHIGEAPSARRKSLFMRLAKIFGKKSVVHFHAFDTASTIEGQYKDVYRRLFDDADRVVVLSEMWKTAVNSVFALGEKIKVLYNPCPDVKTAMTDIRKRKIILSAGVLNPRKGYGDLIRAFAKISSRHPEWKLVFAGSGEIDKAKEIAVDSGVESQVEFPGWVSGDDKDRLFRETSILCLPSYAEGFPMAVLDAWAYGLPVVATPVGGLPDIVHDGEDVLLFKPGDCDKLAEQLDRMIADDELRQKISRASCQFAQEVFNVATIGKQLGEIYRNLK